MNTQARVCTQGHTLKLKALTLHRSSYSTVCLHNGKKHFWQLILPVVVSLVWL